MFILICKDKHFSLFIICNPGIAFNTIGNNEHSNIANKKVFNNILMPYILNFNSYSSTHYKNDTAKSIQKLLNFLWKKEEMNSLASSKNLFTNATILIFILEDKCIKLIITS